MKITLEISDFYLDEGEELVPALKDHIIREVVSQIMKQIGTKTEQTINQVARQQIQEQLLNKTNIVIDEFLKNGKVKGEYSNDGPVSIEQYIKQKFENKNGWGNPSDQIAKLAEKFGAELRNRYDLAFATQIVKKLDKEGLLKDNIAQLLLEK